MKKKAWERVESKCCEKCANCEVAGHDKLRMGGRQLHFRCKKHGITASHSPFDMFELLAYYVCGDYTAQEERVYESLEVEKYGGFPR